MKKILLSPPHMTGREQLYIQEAFDTNWVAPLGPNVKAFEEELATYTGSKKALVTSSGTAAIHLALSVLDVGKGDSVFCSSFTFVATTNPVLYLGGDVVFIDSEEDTWNMCPLALEVALEEAAKQGKLPKAIIVVHLYGQSAKMTELMAVAKHYHVPVIEDAAESLGALYENKKSGTHGDMGIYSFNGNKIITSSGGGALISNNERYIEKALHLATQAKDPAPYYQHSVLGYNYRMSNISAGIGRAQLEVIDDRVSARRAIFTRYEQELGMVTGVSFLKEYPGTHSNRWLSTALLDPSVYTVSPLELIEHLQENGIEARALWKPLHLQPLYKDTPMITAFPNQKPICETLFETGLCLPSGSSLTEEEQSYVISTLKKHLAISKRHLPLPTPVTMLHAKHPVPIEKNRL